MSRLEQDGANGELNGARSSLALAFDAAAFSQHLDKLLPALLGADRSDVAALVASNEYQELASRFGQESSVPVLYVVKSRLPQDATATVEEEGPLAA